MINLILPIVNKESAYQKMLDEFANRDDVTIYCGVKSGITLNFPQNAIVKTYDSKSRKEEIINALHAIPKSAGGTMVVRRPITTEEFEKLKNSKADIVSLCKSKNKFTAFWTNLWKKIIKGIFAFFYFEDISAIYLKENLYTLITNLSNLSYITRIDRFVGYTQETIVTTAKSPKKEYDAFLNFSQLLVSVLFVALCVVWSIILCSCGGNIVVMALLSVLLVLISVLVLFVSILSFVRARFVGNLRFGSAEEIV